MTTAINIISRSFRRAGILGAGETPSASETSDALSILNELLEMWSMENLMIYRRSEIVHSLNGSESYTIGQGADINTDRPINIVSAFVRSDGFDYPVSVVSDDMFNSVCQKTLTGRPDFLRYDAGMPIARIDLWPVPDSEYELHLITDAHLSKFNNAADNLIFPPGYERALRLALAVDLCGEFEREVPVDLAQLAIDAKATVKRVNMQQTESVFDVALTGRGYTNFISG